MRTSLYVRLNVSAALVSAALAGCDTTGEGGGTSGGGSGGTGQASAAQNSATLASSDAAPSASTGDDRPCGLELGGPKCDYGMRCDPENDLCGEDNAPLRCQIYNRSDCSILTAPFCDTKPLSCGMAGQPYACGCSGEILPADCVAASSGIDDAENCAGDGTFACGQQTCRHWLDVCVQSALDAEDGECRPATELGCDDYGMADCRCIEEGDRICVVGDTTFKSVYLLSEAPR